MSVTTTAETRLSHADELDKRKDLIKKLFCKGSTDDELQLFMHACKRTGLDPFMKQIYAIKRGSSLTIQTGIDGFRLIAERTGKYSPGGEATFVYDDKMKLVSATSYIKKMTSDGTWHEVAATAYMDEYDAKQGLWSKMPRAMLSKCAEALALRKAFPAELSGLYTSEEMDQATVQKEVIDSIPEIPFDDEPAAMTEEQCSKLDHLLCQITVDEVHRLAALLKIDSIYDMHPKDYDRVIRAIEKKIKQKEAKNEPSAVA